MIRYWQASDWMGRMLALVLWVIAVFNVLIAVLTDGDWWPFNLLMAALTGGIGVWHLHLGALRQFRRQVEQIDKARRQWRWN